MSTLPVAPSAIVKAKSDRIARVHPGPRADNFRCFFFAYPNKG